MDTNHPNTCRTDEEILAVALREVVNALGLEPGLPTYDTLQLVRLYDNLATQFGGDEELMRHWVHNRNSHLRFTPYARAHNPRYLSEMNDYLEGFRYR
jgi:hypothetical protein